MASAEAGTLQAARRLVWLLVVPVLLLLVVLSLLQYQQRMLDAKRDLLRRAGERAQELDALARPAMHHVHDLLRLLVIHWDEPPDAGPRLSRAMSPLQFAQTIDGWSLDAAPQPLRDQLGQVWWAPPDRRAPENLWLRRAQAFVELARVAQERSPGFESAWFVAGDVNVSFGYPWVSTPQMLAAMGLPSLRALEPLRVAGVLRAQRRRAQGLAAPPIWGEPYVSQINEELVQSHVAQVWRDGQYLGEVSVDVRLDAMQQQARQWQAPGGLVWVASNGGFVMADSSAPLPPPPAPGLGDTPVQVSLASRLPTGVAADDLKTLLGRAGADGSAGQHEVAGWALVAAKRSGSPWWYVEATPMQQLRQAVGLTLLPNALLGAALLAVFLAGQWLISRWFVTPALAVLAYMRQLSLDAAAPAPALGPRWRSWVSAITETFVNQRRLQQRERAHEAFKSAMVDNAPMAIVTQDEAGRVVEFNPAAERLLGLSRDQAVGQALPGPLLGAPAAGSLPAAPAAGGVTDITGLRSDGSTFAAQVQRFALPQETGNYQIAFITDLTARQAAARQIESQREALRQGEKLSAMGSLLAGVAHELNNPLSVVMGRASLLEEKLGRTGLSAAQYTGDSAQDDARRVRLAAERCGRIVRTFLNMARQRPPQRRPVQLGDVVQAAADLLGYTLRGHGIAVELALAAPLPDVQADPDQLGQVVLNLVVNAQQALLSAAPGASQPQAPRIVLRSGWQRAHDGQQARVWLRVADNGPGVPAAAREQIFQPFFTTKADGLGTGLGLSVSQAIVREHGGSLVLETTAVGACFKLSLPLSGHDESGATALALPAARPAPTHCGRVLVVDDEPELADLMRAMLESVGLEVATAESGAVALQLLAEARFDAVVSDLRMPDMDGFTLWQAVCAHDAALGRRMLFVSGDTLSGAAQQWLQAQGLPSLDKPFTNDELLAAVRLLMAR